VVNSFVIPLAVCNIKKVNSHIDMKKKIKSVSSLSAGLEIRSS